MKTNALHAIPSLALLAALTVSGAALAQAVPDYALVKSVALGAPDHWDYVSFEPETRRVFVAHGDRVTVVDGRDGAILGQVTGFPGGTHGIAFVVQRGKGYTDDGEAGAIGVFDLKSLAKLKSIKGAVDADGIAVDPLTGKVFVINGDSRSVTVVDPATDAVEATIDLGGKLEFAVADGAGKLYVNGEEKREILRVDTRSNKVDARWPVPQCASPHGAAIDTASQRLFVSCVNNLLVVLDVQKGAIVASLPIGSGSDAVAFDPVRKRVFSSNGRDGTISVLEERTPDRYIALADIKTAVTAKTMTLDPRTGRLYVAAGEAAASGGTPAGRAKTVPGSLRLLFIDPVK